jgi:hypothetical protein
MSHMQKGNFHKEEVAGVVILAWRKIANDGKKVKGYFRD